MLANLLRQLADFIEGPRTRVVPTGTPRFDVNEKASNERQDTALSLLDPQVHGYVLLMLRADGHHTGRVAVRAQVEEEHWPAFIETMHRTEATAQEDFVGR